MTEKLESIVSFSKGNGLSKDYLNDNGLPCILYGELYTKYLGKIDEIYSKTAVVPSNPKYSKTGDIIMPLSGETPIDISNSAVIPNDRVLLGSDLLVLTPKDGFDPLFLSYYISNCKKKEIARKACGISIIHSHKCDLEKIVINYPSISEQIEISNIIAKLDKKINLISSKISILKKYKKGLENYIYQYVKKHGETFMFRELFYSTNKKNNLLLKQYTVGKYGIKEMDEGKYDISNHKVFNPKNLIVGIGIEEIGISEDIKGAVSPIYDVFNLNNNLYYDSIRFTLKKQLWNKRNFITKNQQDVNMKLIRKNY